MRALLDLIIGDPQADRAVPKTGSSAQLTVFVAGAMAFLAVFALALTTTAGRTADRWSAELAQSATLRLPADVEQADAMLNIALRVLDTTPGVASARALTVDEQRGLLDPWFGSELSLDILPIPQLVEIIAEDDGYDQAGLAARLAAEVPGAILDDHTSWRAPLIAAARRLRFIGGAVVVLIIATMGAMITLAAQASLAANAQVIRVLRLVGARDVYIARAFVRRFTLRAGAGGLAGVIIGLLGLMVLPTGTASAGFMLDVGFAGAGWLWPLVIPPLAAIVAFIATRSAALRQLREQT